MKSDLKEPVKRQLGTMARLLGKSQMLAPASLLLNAGRYSYLAGSGETAVICGVYNIQTVRKWQRSVGPEGRIIAIEANPDSAQNLMETIGQDDNVTALHMAVMDKPGEIEFLASTTDYHGWDCVIDPENPFDYPEDLDRDGQKHPPQTIKVASDSLDNILRNQGLESLDVLRLTINGVELLALKGAQHILDASPKARILITCQYDRDLAEEVRSYLQGNGFAAHIFNSAKGHEIVLASRKS